MEITHNDFQSKNSVGYYESPLDVLRNQMMTATMQSLSAQSDDYTLRGGRSISQSGSNIASAHAIKYIQHGENLDGNNAMVASAIFNDKTASGTETTRKSASTTETHIVPSRNFFASQLLSSANTEAFQLGETLRNVPHDPTSNA
jgi:hypothetical protein